MAARRKIIWSPRARHHLRELYEGMRLDRPAAAKQWAEHVLRAVGKLAQFPQMGRVIPELGHAPYRELVIGEYRIFHAVNPTAVHIFGILHSKRLFRIDPAA